MVRTPQLRVLVVEDNEDVGEMLALLLESMGCTVELRRDGRAGLTAGLSATFDLAILDLGLPELDGFEVATGLRAGPQGADLTIVALSGYTQPEHVQRARAVGFDRHLAKPISDSALRSILRFAQRRRDRESTSSVETDRVDSDLGGDARG